MVRRLALCAAALLTLLGALASAPAGAELDPNNGWDYRSASVGGTYQAVRGYFGGDLGTDILFYAPGGAPDSLWIAQEGARGQDAGFKKIPLSIGGDYQLIVGDFAGDDYDDIIFYGPGAAPDYLWVSVRGPAYFDKTRRVTIGGSYQPKVLHDYRDLGTKDDILFLGPGALPDYYWHFTDRPGDDYYRGPGTYASRPLAVNGNYQIVPGDYSGDGIEDVILYQPGAAFDYKWIFNAAGQQAQTPLTMGGNYRPVVTYQPKYDGVFWYGNGTGRSVYWAGDGRNFGTRPIANTFDVPGGTPVSFAIGASLVPLPAEQDFIFYGTAAEGRYFTMSTAPHDQTTATPIYGDFDDDDMVDILWYGAGGAKDELWYGYDPSRSGGGVPGGIGDVKTTPVRVR